MGSDLTINGCKCQNQHHFADAQKLIGRVAPDSYTMNVFYNVSEKKVTLKCYWCDYEAEVDVSNRPLNVKRFIGGWTTVGPPAM